MKFVHNIVNTTKFEPLLLVLLRFGDSLCFFEDIGYLSVYLLFTHIKLLFTNTKKAGPQSLQSSASCHDIFPILQARFQENRFLH